jgi:multisubunit Na+/H+ antiporter MnhE subunit
MAISDEAAADGGWRGLARVTGITGLTSTILVLGAVVAGPPEEPAFDAPATEFVKYYRSPGTPATGLRSFVLAFGLIVFVWFVVTLTRLLRRAEGEPSWRSAVALVSGVLLPIFALTGSEVAVAYRAGDLDPQIARYGFDQSHVAFANGWVGLGSFAICCGWITVSTGVLPRWLGWLAIVIGAGLVLCRLDWTGSLWLLPYLAFWLWTLTVAAILLRRGLRTAGNPEDRAGPIG